MQTRGAPSVANRFTRLDETERAPLTLIIDGREATALEGDTLLVAILAHAGDLGSADFGGRSQAGFCLMGACQDCWVWSADGERLRACTTVVRSGMDVRTSQPEGTWPICG